MFIPFFLKLKEVRIPVSLREYLSLLEAMEKGLVDYDVEGFYHLARTTLVKDERHYDRFDVAFADFFKGLEAVSGLPEGVEEQPIPDEWLRKMAEKHLTKEEMAEIESLGGFEKLMETLKERLKEQQGRHQGGSKWIGTAGTSPFGAYGYNPEGVRIGQHESRHRRAVKVWDKREFKNLDDSRELGTRNIKVALKRLRRWVRQGAAEEFDLDGTIQSTAEHGYLDVQTRPERRNAVKLLLFMDVGGSMDDHIKTAEELFSAAKAEFKNLEYFYFHNCLYEQVWKDNIRRMSEVTPTWDIFHKFGSDHRVVMVGDAAMSPYEITAPGGSVEHWNEEPGALWTQRLLQAFPHCVWLNPEPQQNWPYTQSIGLVQQLIGGRMHPLSVDGIQQAMIELKKPMVLAQ